MIKSMTVKDLAILCQAGCMGWDENVRPYLHARGFLPPDARIKLLYSGQRINPEYRTIYLDNVTISDRNNISISDYFNPDNMHDFNVSVTYNALFKAPDPEYAIAFNRARFASARGINEDPVETKAEIAI